MEPYLPSRTCPCVRCKAQELLAPALLVTFGVLFLVDNLHWRGFGQTWPLILIVIGGVRLLQTTGSLEGHRTAARAEATVDEPPTAPGEAPAEVRQ
jgi:hypothetical protein